MTIGIDLVKKEKCCVPFGLPRQMYDHSKRDLQSLMDLSPLVFHQCYFIRDSVEGIERLHQLHRILTAGRSDYKFQTLAGKSVLARTTHLLDTYCDTRATQVALLDSRGCLPKLLSIGSVPTSAIDFSMLKRGLSSYEVFTFHRAHLLFSYRTTS